jgi:cell division protein FtsZ
MAGMGHAVMGTAVRSGSHRAVEAAQAAMASPLLEAGAIDGARGILINITGSTSLKLAEVQEACTIIQSAADEDANIIFGAVLDEKMKDAVKITVIATGFKDSDHRRRRQEERSIFVSSRESSRHDDFFDEPQREVEADPEPPMVMQQAAPSAAVAASGDSISIDSMRNAMIANFEQSDLDVPAFLRKRSETM